MPHGTARELGFMGDGRRTVQTFAPLSDVESWRVFTPRPYSRVALRRNRQGVIPARAADAGRHQAFPKSPRTSASSASVFGMSSGWPSVSGKRRSAGILA